MEENKVFVPKPPKELRQNKPAAQNVEITENVAEEKQFEDTFQPATPVQAVSKPKYKINWDLLLNWVGLSISVAAMAVFLFLLAR